VTATRAENGGGVGWDGASPLFHVVLHEPEIPNNTGNIGRTCVALRSALHLVHPLGFDISEKACRRAGLDYWPRLAVHEHASWVAYKQHANEARDEAAVPRRWFLTTRATCSVFEADFEIGDHLVFGKESKGLPSSILDEDRSRCVCLPMVAGERSLNLSTAVAAVMYGALQCLVQGGRVALDEAGRLGAARAMARTE
jgi:tRNA (cytidine/uridine-2'-O-)-methyltransferase